MNPLLMTILLIVALAVFGRTMVKKIQLLRALQPTDRINRIKDRLVAMLVLAVGQKRLIGRSRERGSGIMHAFIFWGFCVLLIRSLTIYGEGYQLGFHLPLLGDDSLLGYVYILIKDIMEGLVLLAVLYAIFRRAVMKPERMHNTFEAYLVLVLICILMISDLLYDGTRYNLIQLHGNPDNLHFFNNAQFGTEFAWSPVSTGAAALVSGLGADAGTTLMTLMFWTHVITQLVFLNILPTGKHFHVITALPNVFLKSLDYPHEKTKWLDLEDEAAWEDESLGINHIHQLDWKQGLDLYTCTECGRCKEVCPAYVTDKPLSLHACNDDLKHEMIANADNIIQKAQLTATLGQIEDEAQLEKVKEEIFQSFRGQYKEKIQDSKE